MPRSLTTFSSLLTRSPRVQIIPRAVDYFTGKALEYDMLSDDEEDYDEDDEEDDGDGFDDDVVRLPTLFFHC